MALATSMANYYYDFRSTATNPSDLRFEDSIQHYDFRGANLAFLEDTSHESVLAGPAETGKTLSALMKLHKILWENPNAQGVILRKVQADLWPTVIQTFHGKILRYPPGDANCPLETVGGYNKPERYIYPNGSVLWTGGLDRPGKALSSERGVAYANQCEEINRVDWETILTRVTGREGKVSTPQVFGDANPSYPQHWIKQREAQGVLKLFASKHKDNPALYDEDGEITAQGERTMRVLLDLTGITKMRLADGLWVQAEGVIYTEFDETIHCINRGQFDEKSIKRVVAGVDWGFTNPGVVAVYAQDGDGRLYRIAETYRTQTLIDEWVEIALAYQKQYDIDTFICDPSESEHIAKFKQSGLYAIGANNSVSAGIGAVKARLKVQDDDLPRVRFVRGNIDSNMVGGSPFFEQKKWVACCTEDEFGGYVFATSGNTEKPALKQVDHGLDALRYVVMYFDGADATPTMTQGVYLTMGSTTGWQ